MKTKKEELKKYTTDTLKAMLEDTESSSWQLVWDEIKRRKETCEEVR